MKMTDEAKILEELKIILAGVFNLDSADDVRAQASVVADLGADSLDFVEIMHLIERRFSVALNADEIMTGSADLKTEELFAEGRLTEPSAAELARRFPDKAGKIAAGMGRLELFSLFTVADLARLIGSKQTGNLP